jgi:TadE-like protein
VGASFDTQQLAFIPLRTTISAMMRGFRKQRRGTRFGTTAVETALVLPIFLCFVLGMVELSRAVFVQHVLNSACRKAARLGSTEGNTTATVKAKTLEILGSAVNTSAVTVFVKDASAFDAASPGTTGSALEGMPDIELSGAKPRQMFMIRAKIKYSDIAIVKKIPIIGYFMQNVTLDGQAFMRHE